LLPISAIFSLCQPKMSRAILAASAIRPGPWSTPDPFLFCVYHFDQYPAGNSDMGPGRTGNGADFDPSAKYRMYHGGKVPGFPKHPHRGFETITIVLEGVVDHADSLGACGRFGEGDVQWMTAGKGISHSEMFPLRKTDGDNNLRLFQIWLNLPRAQKMSDPHFSMHWADDIPKVSVGNAARITVYAGEYEGAKGCEPPPASYANKAVSDLAVWLIELDKSGAVVLPPAKPGSNRSLYCFTGGVTVGGQQVRQPTVFELDPSASVEVASASDTMNSCLVLQGKPIGEPVAQHGPFVMTTQQEIREAFMDYQKSQFGGWPWKTDSPCHPREKGRFAKYPDGREDAPK